MNLLGAPIEDMELLKHLSDDIAGVKQFSGGDLSAEKIHAAHRAIGEMKRYVTDMAARYRRDSDRTPAMAALLDAEEGRRLNEDELTATFVVIFYAAHESTTNMIGNGLYDLLRLGEAWKQMCAAPSLASSAVDEVLRFNPPVQMMVRMPIEDVRIGEELIRAGERTMILFAAANRDPEAYEAPESFDIQRGRSDHMAFGRGVHVCLGASLARIEGRVVFQTLARRFPDMRLAVEPETLEWNPHAVFRGLKKLPVVLGADRGRGVGA
jgi:cytochrome P450